MEIVLSIGQVIELGININLRKLINYHIIFYKLLHRLGKNKRIWGKILWLVRNDCFYGNIL
jgi:hypothetical protein